MKKNHNAVVPTDRIHFTVIKPRVSETGKFCVDQELKFKVPNWRNFWSDIEERKKKKFSFMDQEILIYPTRYPDDVSNKRASKLGTTGD